MTPDHLRYRMPNEDSARVFAADQMRVEPRAERTRPFVDELRFFAFNKTLVEG